MAADSAGTTFDTAAATSASGTAPGNFGGDNVSKPASTGPHPDPITGEPGAHPVGTGAGALAGGVAGVAIGGAIGGPIGAPIGAAIGAVAGAVSGGYAGKGIAESIDPTDENAFWEKSYRGASYYEGGYDYTDYSPAYRTGYEGFGRYATAGREYPDVEGDLEREYSSNRGSSKLDWDKAKHAARDAWDRVKGKVSGPTS